MPARCSGTVRRSTGPAPHFAAGAVRGALVPHRVESRPRHIPRVRPDASYLVTGGFGALGSQVARWPVANGARHLVLCGRRPPSEQARQAIGDLEQRGAMVMVAETDVSESGAVARLLETIAGSMPPLRGVVHAAGVVEDAMLRQFDPQALRRVFAPKVAGTWNLHTLTGDVPLDVVVCFSSAASMIGSAGQGQYAAASAFMDALASDGETMGLWRSINWGAWSGFRHGGELGEAFRRWARCFASLSRRRVWRSLEEYVAVRWRISACCRASTGTVPAGDLRPACAAAVSGTARRTRARQPKGCSRCSRTTPWTKRDGGARSLAREIMATLGLRNADAIDAHELLRAQARFPDGDGAEASPRSKLRHEIGATTIFDYPSLERLVDRLVEPIAVRTAPPVVETPVELSEDQLGEPIEHAIADELELLEALIAGHSHE